MSSAHVDAMGHRALLYESREELVTTAAPYLREAVERGDAAVAVVGRRAADALRDALGDVAGAVSFRDQERFYETPVNVLTHWTHDLAAQHGSHRLRAVSEPWFGATREAREWARAEAVFSATFADSRADMLCAYDASALPEAVLADARATHPTLVGAGTALSNPLYGDPIAFLRELDSAPFPPPPAAAHELPFDEQPAPARRFAAERARMAGLAGERLDDVRVAVTEIATNAVLHGCAPRVIRAWVQERSIVFEVQDGGEGITSPLTGFVVPSVEATAGRGVWIARRVCDLVEVRGARVRLHLGLG